MPLNNWFEEHLKIMPEISIEEDTTADEDLMQDLIQEEEPV